MIDDEIADQPGLVMLGQVDYCSYSVGFIFFYFSFFLGLFLVWWWPFKCKLFFCFFSSRTQFRRHRCILGDPNCFITTYRPCPWSIIRRRKTINRTSHPTITGQCVCGVMGVVSAWTSCSSRGVPVEYISKGLSYYFFKTSPTVAGGPRARKRDVSDRTHSSVMKSNCAPFFFVLYYYYFLVVHLLPLYNQ